MQAPCSTLGSQRQKHTGPKQRRDRNENTSRHSSATTEPANHKTTHDADNGTKRRPSRNSVKMMLDESVQSVEGAEERSTSLRLVRCGQDQSETPEYERSPDNRRRQVAMLCRVNTSHVEHRTSATPRHRR